MIKSFKLPFIFMVILSLSITIAGCGSSDSNSTAEKDRDYFKIGVITELSGDNAYGGNLTRRGYESWMEEANKNGGVEIDGKKYKVEMVYADAQSKPEVGADAVERMITKEKVDFILGPYSSGVTLAVAPIVEKYRIPMITGSAESPMIWLQKFKYTFGTIPAVNLTASYPIRTLDNKGAKSIAIIGMNDAFSKATAETFKATAEEVGMEILKYDIVPAGTDFTPLLSAIKELNPDIVGIAGHEKEHMEVIKASKSLDFIPQTFVMHYGVTNPDFVNNLGKDADYVFGASVWTKDSGFQDPIFGTTEDYAEAYKTRWGDYPDYTAAGCTTAGVVFHEAIQKAKVTPPLDDKEKDALVKALEEISVETLYGKVEFATEGDWYHNNTGLNALTIQILDGQVKIVGPPEVQKADPVYPMPGWDER